MSPLSQFSKRLQCRIVASHAPPCFDYWELTKPEINFPDCHYGSGRVLDGLTRPAPAFSVDTVPWHHRANPDAKP